MRVQHHLNRMANRKIASAVAARKTSMILRVDEFGYNALTLTLTLSISISISISISKPRQTSLAPFCSQQCSLLFRLV